MKLIDFILMKNVVFLLFLSLAIFINTQPKVNCLDLEYTSVLTKNSCVKNGSNHSCKSENKEKNNTNENICCNLICCKNLVFIEIVKSLEEKVSEIEKINYLVYQKTEKLIRNFNSGYFHPPDFI